jgi:hypothetical protein
VLVPPHRVTAARVPRALRAPQAAGPRTVARRPEARAREAPQTAATAVVPAQSTAKPTSPTASWVYVNGYQLMVGQRASNGTLATPTPFKLKGVSWSPTAIGESNSQGYVRLYTEHGGTDIPLITGLHANAVKTSAWPTPSTLTASPTKSGGG